MTYSEIKGADFFRKIQHLALNRQEMSDPQSAFARLGLYIAREFCEDPDDVNGGKGTTCNELCPLFDFSRGLTQMPDRTKASWILTTFMHILQAYLEIYRETLPYPEGSADYILGFEASELGLYSLLCFSNITNRNEPMEKLFEQIFDDGFASCCNAAFYGVPIEDIVA